MNCMTSFFVFCSIAIVVTSALRVPSSWDEEVHFETYKTKLRKARQKPTLERKIGGYAQANYKFKTKNPKETNIPENVPLVVDSPSALDHSYQVQNDWTLTSKPSSIIINKNEEYTLPLEAERDDFAYNAKVPTYQKSQDFKTKSNENYHKAVSHLAEADLIRQLERHKMIQENLATIDQSPGRLRAIYLKDQLNRNAINHNQYPATTIDPLKITFTTILPEVTQTPKRTLKVKSVTLTQPEDISPDTREIKTETKGERIELPKNHRVIESETKNNILITNHRVEKLNEPHRDDNSERDDSLHEPTNDKDVEKISDIEDEADTSQIDEDVESASSKESQKHPDEETEEEDATSDEENEESDEEPVNSELANPNNIPTKPIYPGEGQWARPGRRYRPHVSPHQFAVLSDHPQEEKPQGYDIFEDLSKYFENQRASFEQHGQFSPGQVVPTTKALTFGEQLQAELPTPPSNTWQPNSHHYVNPVNPIVVYDPFSEPSINHKSTIVNSPQKLSSQGPIQSHELKEKSDNSSESDEGKVSSDNPEHDKNNSEEESRHTDKQESNENEDIEVSSAENEEDYENENDEDELETIDPESSFSVEEEVEDDDDDFTPMQLYTQVRHSANVAHLPSDPEENGRLKEVIKDSKVQTVYTEEGYEDLAYDHAGHEKKAESDEGFAEFEKNKEEKGKRERDSNAKQSVEKKTFDSVPLGTQYKTDISGDNLVEQSIKRPANKIQSSNNFVSTKQIKTTELKDIGDGKLQMEIQNKVKTVMQPNNSDTAQSVLTVYPKIYHDLNTIPNVEESTSENEIFTTDFPVTTLKDTLSMENRETSGISSNHSSIPEGNDLMKNLTENRSILLAIIPTDDDYWDESNTPEANTNADESTEAYFDPETDNFNVEEISVKSVADIFRKLKNANTSEPEKLSNEVNKGIKPLNKIDNQFEKSFVALARQKRGSGFLDVKVDTDFIPDINHTLPPKPPRYDVEKYPYYKDPSIPENSPLHYAENMKNIPKKVDGKLSFYEKAEEMECPELDIPDPIPDHVKNKASNQHDDYEDKERNEKPGAPKKPRIEIGSKIKCYKKRYFGDQPLDSPFFKEEYVGKVKPIFKELTQKSVSLSDDSIRESNLMESINTANEIFNQIDANIKHKLTTELKLKEKEFASPPKEENQILKTPGGADSMQPLIKLFASNTLLDPKSTQENSINILTSTVQTTTPAITSSTVSNTTPQPKVKTQPLIIENSTILPLPALITTPRYTLKLTPKNIYDQITLLDHLDTSGTEVLRFIKSDFDTMPIEANRRESKELKNKDEEDNVTLEPQPLRRRKYRPLYTRPKYHVILNKRGTTTTPFPIIDTKPTTVLPKYKVISEVFYKDEIQPNEQLAVFSDILNNIRNASNLEKEVQVQSTSNFAEPSTVTIASINSIAKRNQPVKNRKRQEAILAHNPLVKPKHKTSTFRPISSNIVKLLQQKSPKYNTQKQKSPSLQRWKVYTTTTTKMPNEEIILRKSHPTTIDFLVEPEEILGLVPPTDQNYNTIVLDDIIDKEDITDPSVQLPPDHLYQYKTIILPTTTEQLPAPVSETMDEPIVIQLNKYLFLGLKPPKPQKVRSYTDFVVDNFVRRKDLANHRRYKRDAQRPVYSELSRNRGRQEEILEKPEVVDDDVDDYVPHRPRNYYYDEKTGKIVYLNSPKQKSEEEEEESIEYEEITEARPAPKQTSPKPQTKLLLATAKPPAPGESFIDFLSKVKNDPTYKFIPDPTTTDKGSIPVTEKAITTERPTVSTNPPEFLNILAKIKSDSSYKVIEDPDTKKKTKITTTTEAVEEYEEEPDSQEDRFRDVEDKGGIFDISGYLPEVKEYTPQTRIDYSKYKTINRGSNRQRPTTGSKEEKIDYTAIVRARRPVYDDEETLTSSSTTTETPAEIRDRVHVAENPKVSESRYDDVSDIETTTKTTYRSILQNRRRPSTTTTTSKPNRVETSEKSLEILAPPVQTRRGTRPTTSTSETTPALEIQEPSTRIPPRRRRPTTPRGFQPSVELVKTTEAVVRVYPENHSAKRVYRRQPVHIRSKSIRDDDELEDESKLIRRRSEKLSDVGQSTFLDPVYSKENDETQIDRDDRSIDNVGKNRNQDVEIFKDYEKNIKHGGNYKHQNEESDVTEENKQVEEEVYILVRPNVKSNKDKRQDNNRKENSRILLRSRNHGKSSTSPKEDVEVVRNIDKSRKTGGNYKPEDELVEEELLNEDSQIEENPSVDSPDIVPENDKEILSAAPKSKRLIYNVNNYAGKSLSNLEKPERLTDVVPKPDHFYTDPNLPKQVNQIRDIKSLPKINSEELEEIVTEGDHVYSREVDGGSPLVEDKQIQDRLDVVEESSEDYVEEENISSYENDKTVASTKKPFFIKDPEKRLYYYAPV